MVVDVGGGTADVTVYNNPGNGSLSEVHYATGGPWGSMNVNREFESLLKEIMGEEFINGVKDTPKYLDLMDRFEVHNSIILILLLINHGFIL